MTTEALSTNGGSAPATSSLTLYKRSELTRDQVDLLKRTIAYGSTDDELKLFVSTCDRLGLDPFARQIFAVKRWDSRAKREVMAIQVSIDGFRLVAERTGNYAPGPKPTFTLTKEGTPATATAYVKKWARGEWHVVEAEAAWNEYVQRTREGSPNRMWSTMPRVMLSKCAEALALRKAFPAELSGVYTVEEMGQADNDAPSAPKGRARSLDDLAKAIPPVAAEAVVEMPEPGDDVELPPVDPEDESQDPVDQAPPPAKAELAARIAELPNKHAALGWMKKHRAELGPAEFEAFNRRIDELAKDTA